MKAVKAMASTKLLGIYSNGIVLQRNKEIIIEGEEASLAEVKITLAGVTRTAEVTDGKFKAFFPPFDVVVDDTLKVEGTDVIELKDVCVGDVYMLAGQSNMELPVIRTVDLNKEEIEAKDYPLVRQYYLTPDYEIPLKGEEPSCRLPEADWIKAEGDSKYAFSAVGFYAAKRIFEKTNVPIGLILNAQGGSTIENFMCEEDLFATGTEEKDIAPYRGKGVLKAYLDEGNRSVNEWRENTIDKNFSLEEALKDAKTVNLPGIVVTDHSGSVWFVKEFEVKDPVEGECLLKLGDLIDADVTYINGVEVGRTEYQYPPRNYRFDGSILKAGRNTISVRLIIEHERGGFVCGHPYVLFAGSQQIDMTGEWKLVYEKKAEEFIPHLLGPFIPSAVYYSSVITLKNIAISQMWWYQGESNADKPEGYDQKMIFMIKRIRQLFGDVPVVLVRIADYINPITFATEVPEGWREIQRLQDEAPSFISNLKVVRSPAPDPVYELHPQNKSSIGEEIANAVLSF